MAWNTILNVILRLPLLYTLETAVASQPKELAIFKPIMKAFDFPLAPSIEKSIWLCYFPAFLAWFLLFFYDTKQLLQVYGRMASFGIIVHAYAMNTANLRILTSSTGESNKATSWLHSVISYAAQLLFAFIFSLMHAGGLYRLAFCIICLLPNIACTFHVDTKLLNIMPFTIAAISIALLANSITKSPALCHTIPARLERYHQIIDNRGVFAMLNTNWKEMHLDEIFLAFWIIKLMIHFAFMWINGSIGISITEFAKEAAIHGSESIINLLGMTSCVAHMFTILANSIQSFLQYQLNHRVEKDIGTIAAVFFFTYSLQSNITNLDSATRISYINRNLCLLDIALMEFAFQLLNPILISVSIMRNVPSKRLIKTLLTTVVLFAKPTAILIYEWNTQNSNPWLFVLTAFLLEIIAKLVIVLIICILHKIDMYTEDRWENLEDYVYYLNRAISLIEILLGAFLLFNSLKIFGEKGGAIRAVMTLLHVYFNVFNNAKKFYKTVNTQRMHDQQTRALFRYATADEIKQKDDVCIICFGEIKSARITACKHYFHAGCIRKWLDYSNICPMCKTTLEVKIPLDT